MKKWIFQDFYHNRTLNKVHWFIKKSPFSFKNKLSKISKKNIQKNCFFLLQRVFSITAKFGNSIILLIFGANFGFRIFWMHVKSCKNNYYKTGGKFFMIKIYFFFFELSAIFFLEISKKLSEFWKLFFEILVTFTLFFANFFSKISDITTHYGGINFLTLIFLS